MGFLQVLEGFPKMALVAWTPLIIGSLTAGSSKQKDIVVALLTSLPAATAATTLIANSMHSKVPYTQSPAISKLVNLIIPMKNFRQFKVP